GDRVRRGGDGRVDQHLRGRRLQAARPAGEAVMSDEYTAQLADEEQAIDEEESIQGRPYEISAARRGGLFGELVRDKLGFASALFLTLLTLAAIFAPLLAPDDPNRGNLSRSMAPPVWNGGSW